MTSDVIVSEGRVVKVWTSPAGVKRFSAILWNVEYTLRTRDEFSFFNVTKDQRHLITEGARFYYMSRITHEADPEHTTTGYVLTFIRPRPAA